MKNKIPDLNNHLFAQLERLTEEGISAEQVETEVKRSEAVVALSDQIIAGAKLQLDACKLVAMHGDRFLKKLPMLGNGEDDARPIDQLQ